MNELMRDDSLTEDEETEIMEDVFAELEERDKDAEVFQEENEEKKKYEELVIKNSGSHEQALFEYCFINNICYSSEVYKLLTKGQDASVFAQFPELYIDTIKADIRFSGKTFFSQLRKENFEKIYSEKSFLDGLSEDDKKNRQIIMDVFSYDPFKGESLEDRSQLYRDLAGMSSEAMRKDVAKQKAAINIVRTYGNIEKYQRRVAEITATGQVDDETQKQLDQYLKTISNLQASINATAEKNNFTVKGIGSNGKGMLSDVLNQIEERGIDLGITNFYDIDTSKSIGEIANISFKAQLNQVSLSKTDYADILGQQCELVREAQRKAKQALEALRLVKEKIRKQELLEELAIEYKRKGISEEDIQEFIASEYKLYDGID